MDNTKFNLLRVRLNKLKSELPSSVTFLSPLRKTNGDIVVTYKVAGNSHNVSFPMDANRSDYDRLKTLILMDSYESERG